MPSLWSHEGERRAHSRAQLGGPALLDSVAAYHSGRCRDVSVGGVSVLVEAAVPVGTQLEVYFELPTWHAVETVARVVRAAGPMLAVQFLDLDRPTRAALLSFCERSLASRFSNGGIAYS